jgi:hypothetical protein
MLICSRIRQSSTDDLYEEESQDGGGWVLVAIGAAVALVIWLTTRGG